MIKPKDAAESEARTAYNADRGGLDLIIWSDGSKLDIGGVRAGIVWKRGDT